jgi:hypothetical protein
MLFDLETDPNERMSVAKDNPEIMERLKKALLEIKGDD